MHMASDSGPLFFTDIAPIESSSTRIAAEGFYHCLALATKDMIRLEQNEPYGPIKIVIK
ncbi:hypothetical protein JB92DRAFT_3045972 [Gautieria morchelliformis]|nr:hypothetical protein JB92DRAFT_3045972 [Gautieria morchelliformis]